MKRRRFLQIVAGACATAGGAMAAEWQGQVMGADARILLRGGAASGAVVDQLLAEIRRVEEVLSLYRDSELTRLNRDGAGTASPLMHQAMDLALRVHEATGGAFDPLVQSQWLQLAQGQVPSPVTASFARIARDGAIYLPPGQQLTFNGLAQGLATDRVAALPALRDMGGVLVDMGEARALGAEFRLGLSDLQAGMLGQLTLRPGRAIATSSPGALRFAGGESHILGPQGQPPLWSTVSVEADSAALADAAATAFVLLPRPAMKTAAARLGVGPVRLVDFDGNLDRL